MVGRLEASVGPATDRVRESLLVVGANEQTGEALVDCLLEWAFSGDLAAKAGQEKDEFFVNQKTKVILRGELKSIVQTIGRPKLPESAKTSYTKQKSDIEKKLGVSKDQGSEANLKGPAWNSAFNDLIWEGEIARLVKQLPDGTLLENLDNYEFNKDIAK